MKAQRIFPLECFVSSPPIFKRLAPSLFQSVTDSVPVALSLPQTLWADKLWQRIGPAFSNSAVEGHIFNGFILLLPCYFMQNWYAELQSFFLGL